MTNETGLRSASGCVSRRAFLNTSGAQRRAHGVIMQHGSIPISWDLDKMSAVFGLSARGGQSSPAALP